VTCLTFAAHVAHLDPMTGSGLLVLPRPADDVADPFAVMGSLHSSGWGNVIAQLDAMGWEPTQGEDGGVCVDGYLADGRQVIGLFGREPITSNPSLDEAADAFGSLCRAVGLVPMPA